MNKLSQWALGVFVAVLSFASNPHGPLGGFWRPDSMSPDPTAFQMPFFIILNIFESVAFALAIVALFFYLPKRAVAPLTLNQTRGVFFALLWVFGNWWLHDSFHVHIGMDLHRLLFIEYGFHVTMMLSAGYLLWVASKFYCQRKS